MMPIIGRKDACCFADLRPEFLLIAMIYNVYYYNTFALLFLQHFVRGNNYCFFPDLMLFAAVNVLTGNNAASLPCMRECLDKSSKISYTIAKKKGFYRWTTGWT